MPLTQTVTRGSGSNAMRPTIPEDNTKFTAAGAQRERVPKNNCSQRVKTRLNIASGADQGNWNRTQTRIEFTEAVPLLPPRKTLPAGTTIRLPEGGSLKHKRTARGGRTPQEPNAARSRRQNTPTQPRRRDTLPKPLDSCLSQCNLTPDTRARAASPPKTRLDPLSGGSLTFLARPREFARFLLCSGAQLQARGTRVDSAPRLQRHTHTHIHTGEQTRPTRSDRNCCSPDGNQLVAVLFRQRPYSVEHTRSHLNSEVKQPKARSVLGWGTAWEVLRVLLAFCARVCLHWHKRLMPMASELLIADRLSRETTWRRYCYSPGRVVLCYPRQVFSLDSCPSVRHGRIENKSEGPRGPSEQ